MGFKPDYIRVNNEFETVKSDVVIGIYNGKLSRNNLYSSLIGINILKDDNKFENWDILWKDGKQNGKYESKV